MAQFKVATLNANSLRARLPIVKKWLAEEQPDALCLQEIKVQDKDFPSGEFEEMGYQAIFKGQKSYNGVAVITRRPVESIRHRKGAKIAKGFFQLWSNRERRLDHKANPLRDIPRLGTAALTMEKIHVIMLKRTFYLAASHRQIKNSFSASFAPLR
jgi:exonuclease III